MKYKANALVTVQAGTLIKLTKDQASRTAGLVTPVDKPEGWHRVVTPFDVKAGEHIECDMEFGKDSAAVTQLSDAGEAHAPAAKSKPKA